MDVRGEEGKQDREGREMKNEKSQGQGQSLGVPKEGDDEDESGSAVSVESVGTQLAKKMRELTL